MENGQTLSSAGDVSPRPFAARPLAALLKQARMEADLTQEALAERAGVSVRRIRDLERGTAHRPRVDTVRLLAEALGLPPDAHAAFVAAARRPPLPSGDAARDLTEVVASPTVGAIQGRRRAWPARPLVAGTVGAVVVVVLVAGVAWMRGPMVMPAARVPIIHTAVVGPDQMACCWARHGPWSADPAHGYPGFTGQTYWVWAHGATRPPVSTVRWSFTPSPRTVGDGGWRHVAVDVWVPDNNADARVVYVVTDGRSRSFQRPIDQESPAPGFVHRSPGWVRLGTFDGTRDGRRRGGLAVELTDRASTDCTAYHYASRTCVIGAAQVRFTYATETPHP